MQHYFLPHDWQQTTEFQLDAATYKHFVQVLRATEGTEAEFVTPLHELLIAQLVKLDSDHRSATMHVERKQTVDVELPVHARIICGVPKGDKAELITQKATELGVHEIVFVPTQWSVASWKQKAAKKLSRLQVIATNAAQQSHRLVIPQLKYASSLKEAAAMPADFNLVAWEESAKKQETGHLVQTFEKIRSGQTINVIFGPEGGLTVQEVDDLTANGYVAAGLGPRILRTETAPLYFLSALSYAVELQKDSENVN